MKKDKQTYLTPSYAYNVKNAFCEGILKDYIEERAINIATYIIENNATVRQTAKKFGVSKSTVHMEVTIQNDIGERRFGQLNRGNIGALSGGNLGVFLYKFKTYLVKWEFRIKRFARKME